MVVDVVGTDEMADDSPFLVLFAIAEAEDEEPDVEAVPFVRMRRLERLSDV